MAPSSNNVAVCRNCITRKGKQSHNLIIGNMNTNSLKWMKATGIAVIMICCFWIGLGSFLNVLNATVTDGGHMKWNPDAMTWQICVIAGYLLTSVGFAAVITTVIRKTLSGLNKKVYFTLCNARLIFIAGFLYMFMIYFRTNFWHVVKGAVVREFPLVDMAIPALLITTFGYLYTIAFTISEEQKLTI